MELHDALTQISDIRRQMARAHVFRGYRAATAAFSGVMALLAASVQNDWAPDPFEDVVPYLTIWLIAAGASLAVVAVEIATRHMRSGSMLQRELSLATIECLTPSLVAGALLTLALAAYARGGMWLLPGLWAILFSMGLFACRRVMPRGIVIPAGYYLLAGLMVIVLAQGRDAFSPWAMVGTFGVGQFLTAGVLFFSQQERGHG
ncbi:MAG: hypothetical protein WBD40_09005 [Tepidisphaeraceae bacterium]